MIDGAYTFGGMIMSIRLALACAVSVVTFASDAQAGPGRVATEIFVSDVGVDFADPAETATFYAALKRAATKACDSEMDRNLNAIADDRECAVAALDRAVQQMGKSTLAALHEAKTGRAAPTTILAAQ